MQGISTAKHQHLVDALLQLESLLKEGAGDEDRQKAAELRSELEAMYTSYQRQVAELAGLIDSYHELFTQVKFRFLSPRLKELKKAAENNARVMPTLIRNIRLVYGT